MFTKLLNFPSERTVPAVMSSRMGRPQEVNVKALYRIAR